MQINFWLLKKIVSLLLFLTVKVNTNDVGRPS